MRLRLLILVLVAGLAAWLLADVLFGGRRFAYRDAAHYYGPLFQFTSQEWAAGRVPLWNPFDGLGAPLAAGGTSSAFYPGQLLFALPVDFEWAWRAYVVGHLLLAAGGAYALARRWEASVEAAGITAISYAFSGTVLFQYANVVYLVGAAWLPLALWTAERMLAQRRPRWAIVLGAVLAMMVLGGDPQAAYHAGLLAAWLACSRPAATKRSVPALALLALAAAVATGLAAVQVLPSIEFVRRSERAAAPLAGTLYELPEALHGKRLGEWDEAFLGRQLPRGTHREQVYRFSVGPWRVAEFLWPNSSGRQFPVHRRWLDTIPAEGGVWVPSLYMGLLPFVLALSAMRFRVGQVSNLSSNVGQVSNLSAGQVANLPQLAASRDRWLTWSVAVFALGSLGWYGLGWLVHEARTAAGADPAVAWPVGQPFGGVYWLMTVLLPGYAQFRYPAKLMVVVALGLGLLAARGWDRLRNRQGVSLHRWLLGLGVASLGGAGVVAAALPYWARWFSGVSADPLFGPLDATGAAVDLIGALIQSATICGLGMWVLLGAQHAARWAGAAALVLMAVDLAVANRWMIASAPAEAWEKRPGVVRAIEEHPAWDVNSGPYRVYRRPLWTPDAWKETASTARLADTVRWQRDTLQPKYHLGPALPLVDVPDAMNLDDYRLFLAAARRLPGATRLDPLPRKEVLNALGATYLVLRGGESPSGGAERLPATAEDISLWHNPQAMPRAWIVHRVETLPPLASRDPDDVIRRTEEVLDDQGRPRDFGESAVVETDEELPGAQRPPSSGEASRKESCRVLAYGPQQVEIEAVLDSPGLVVLSDQFYPGWTLEVRTDDGEPCEAPILRTNRVMRGAWLSAGSHRLIYRYCPRAFFWGAALSISTLLTLAAWGVIAMRRKTRSAMCGKFSV